MTPELSIDIERDDPAWPAEAEALVERAVRAALAESGTAVVGPAELSVLLASDARQRELNRQWRGIDRPTNVLSFPQIAPGAPLQGLVGDIVLARETVAHEAEAQGIGLADHLTHLAVHGFLHILGYDHQSEVEALEMERLETQILAGLGIADPYVISDGEIEPEKTGSTK